MPPKTNEDYMREIRNIQPAHHLVYERIEQILTEKDQELQKARQSERKQIIDYIGFVHFREPNDKEPYHKYKQQESGANFLRKKILRQLSKDQSELDQPTI